MNVSALSLPIRTTSFGDRLREYPVYRKDLLLLGKALLGILALQVFLILAFQLFSLFLEGKVIPWHQTANALGSMQLIFNPLFALAAAGYCSAEEKAQGTDLFLNRLPVPRKRVYREKLAAGFTSLVALFICQWLLHLIASVFGAPIWASGQGVGFVILALTLGSYLIGLPISLLVKQTLTVILLGAGVELLGFVTFVSLARGMNYRTSSLLWLVIIFCIPVLIGLFSERLRSGGWLSHARMAPTRFGTLLWKSMRENLILYLLTTPVIFLCIMPTPSDWLLGLAIVGGVLLAVLGINTYSPLEKEGTLCMLYHHPLPRRNIFLAKIAPNLLCALVLTTALALAIQQSAVHHFRLGTPTLAVSGWRIPTDLVTLVSGLVLGAGLILAAVFRRPQYILVTVTLTVLAILGCTIARPDAQAYNYLPFTPLLLCGLSIYICGVLMSLAFKRPIYALLTALGATGFTYGVVLYLIVPASRLHDFIRNANAWPKEAFNDTLGALLFWPMLVLFVGLLASAWRTATDRAALTGTEYIRPLYGIRLFCFVLAVTVILTTTGWGDLVYLLTNIDLGLG